MILNSYIVTNATYDSKNNETLFLLFGKRVI